MRCVLATIHFGLESGNQPAAANKTNGNGSKSSLTQAAERAMALRMQAAGKQSHEPKMNNTPSADGAASSQPDQGRRDGDMESNQEGNFYSSPVFPGQMPSNPATRYHAAAQQFQHHSQDDFMDGSGQGRGDAAGPHYSTPQKGLPGFADFRRQLGYPNNAGYSDYQEPMVGSGQFSPGNMMPSSGNYSGSNVLPPTSNFLPGPGEQMSGGYSTSSSVPVYPDMSVFPGMPAQGHGDMRGVNQAMGQGGDMPQPQFDPMLQFQPLSS